MPRGVGWCVDPSQPVEWGHPLNRGRVAWWLGLPQAGFSGSALIRDITRPGYGGSHGVMAGGLSQFPSERGYYGLRTNGTGRATGTTALTAATDLSLAIWIYQASPQTTIKVAIGFGSAVWLGSSVTAGKWNFSCDGFTLLDTATGHTAGWHRITGTRTGGMAYLYVDGMLATSGARTAGSASGAFSLGDFTASGYVWPGDISDPSVWNRCLSAAEVAYDHDLSRRGYRTPDSPLRWITGRTYFAPLSATPSVFSPAFGPGWGFAA